MLFNYSKWDGSQQIFPFDADEVMDALGFVLEHLV